MSIKFMKNKLIIASILGLATAAVMTLFFEQSESILLSKKMSRWSTEHNRNIAGKLNAVMDIKIEPVSGIPDNEEQEITLRATLTLLRNVDSDLNYKWMLPEDVKIVAGHAEDGWGQIQVGQSVSSEITVTGLSKENPGKAVLLHVESNSQGAKVGYSGVFAIEPESVTISGKNSETNEQLNKLEKTKEEVHAERLKGISF